MGKGKSLTDATTMAYKAMEGGITRQTLLLTYDDAYWLSGMVMLFSIPINIFATVQKENERAYRYAH
jgi:DHA2 family multidrug resistance protein